jgi:twitching motility protein PilT
VRATLAGSLKGTICQRLVPTSNGEARVAVLEVMVVNGRIQQCILDAQQTGDIQAIIADGEYYGMQTFDQHLARLYERGTIDWAGALGVASNPHDLRIMVQQRGLASAGRT